MRWVAGVFVAWLLIGLLCAIVFFTEASHIQECGVEGHRDGEQFAAQMDVECRGLSKADRIAHALYRLRRNDFADAAVYTNTAVSDAHSKMWVFVLLTVLSAGAFAFLMLHDDGRRSRSSRRRSIDLSRPGHTLDDPTAFLPGTPSGRQGDPLGFLDDLQ
jgi:hypothetical protein